MGPYYLSSLINLLGPVRSVTGRSSRARQERTVGSGPKQGTTFSVEVETHVSGVLEHESGVLTTLVTSFDVWGARLPRIEIYGSTGSLSVPDPNTFGGDVEVYQPAKREWTVVDEAGGYARSSRGYGLADMARAIRSGGAHRASGDLAYHVLDVMESLLDSAASGGATVVVESTVERPEAVPQGATPDQA
jgi:predicted dehydrogenase